MVPPYGVPVLLAAAMLLLARLPALHGRNSRWICRSTGTYILYEPLIATVTITNNAGPRHHPSRHPGQTVAEHGGDDHRRRPPLSRTTRRCISARCRRSRPGQTVKRQIDLTPLFPIRDLGEHRVRADLYFAEADNYFYSNYVTFDLTSGKTIWRQTVGVPGEPRRIARGVAAHPQAPDRMLLYVRVRDADGDTVYVTRSLGRLVATGREPEVMLDRDNTLHVLQEAVPGAYLYTVVNVDGEAVGPKSVQPAGPQSAEARQG